MASNISVSTALRNYHLDTGALKTALAGGFIYVYTGTVPANADEALSGQTLIGKFGTFGAGSDPANADEPSSGLDFGTAASAALAKDADLWTCRVQGGVSGVNGTFFRWTSAAGSPSAVDNGTTTRRIQGTVGTTGADLNFGNNSWTDDDASTKTIGTAEIRM